MPPGRLGMFSSVDCRLGPNLRRCMRKCNNGPMSTLERRLHLMIDQARYDKLAEEAERTKRSVADIVRSAIDLHFDDAHTEARAQARRAAAARTLLAFPPDEGPAETWEEMLEARAHDIDEMLKG
jgi:hypothetical protein